MPTLFLVTMDEDLGPERVQAMVETLRRLYGVQEVRRVDGAADFVPIMLERYRIQKAVLAALWPEGSDST